MSTTGKTIRSARRLRRTMSKPEVLLWQILRKKPNGIKFRRQHPIGPYVLDFYCPSAKIAIEVDGISHEMRNRPERDERRDQWLTKQGFEVLRISASEILDDTIEVAEEIILYVKSKG